MYLADLECVAHTEYGLIRASLTLYYVRLLEYVLWETTFRDSRVIKSHCIGNSCCSFRRLFAVISVTDSVHLTIYCLLFRGTEFSA